MTNPYATAEETVSVMRQATPDELWLEAQLERIAPNRFDTDVGETDALIKLVFELKNKLSKGAPEYFGMEPWQSQEAIQLTAEQLARRAWDAGWVVTIERKPLKPLAMGHAANVVDVRPLRGKP